MPYTTIEIAVEHYNKNYWNEEDEMFKQDRSYGRPRMHLLAEYKDGGVFVKKVYEKGMHHERIVDIKIYKKGKVYDKRKSNILSHYEQLT